MNKIKIIYGTSANLRVTSNGSYKFVEIVIGRSGEEPKIVKKVATEEGGLAVINLTASDTSIPLGAYEVQLFGYAEEDSDPVAYTLARKCSQGAVIEITENLKIQEVK